MQGTKRIVSSIDSTVNRGTACVMTDPLEQVIGLGAKKLQTLLRHFGGRQGVDEALDIEDLRTVPGIGASLAHRIHEALHPSS